MFSYEHLQFFRCWNWCVAWQWACAGQCIHQWAQNWCQIGLLFVKLKTKMNHWRMKVKYCRLTQIYSIAHIFFILAYRVCVFLQWSQSFFEIILAIGAFLLMAQHGPHGASLENIIDQCDGREMLVLRCVSYLFHHRFVWQPSSASCKFTGSNYRYINVTRTQLLS